MSERLVLAFPARLAQVTAGVADSLPAAVLPPTGSVTASRARTWRGLIVDGEPVEIPYRIYNPEPPRRVGGLSQTGELIAAAIYTRHHDGRIRQRHLGTLLAAYEP